MRIMQTCVGTGFSQQIKCEEAVNPPALQVLSRLYKTLLLCGRLIPHASMLREFPPAPPCPLSWARPIPIFSRRSEFILDWSIKPRQVQILPSKLCNAVGQIPCSKVCLPTMLCAIMLVSYQPLFFMVQIIHLLLPSMGIRRY